MLNSNNVTHIYSKKQDTTEGMTMTGYRLTSYIHSIIIEYGQVKHGTYSLWVDDLPQEELKIFLSRIYEPNNYAWAIENPARLQEILDEEKCYMQSLIDEEAHELYREVMEEMHHPSEPDYEIFYDVA